MGMALKTDVTKACRSLGMQKPVDLVHLAAQTMGDPDLEAEILSMFKVQCQTCIAAYEASADANGRKQAAHLLKGSARGVGAWDLANWAEKAESPAFNDIKGLKASASATVKYIDELA